MFLLVAFVAVAFGCLLLAGALAADLLGNRDEVDNLLRDEKPWGCDCCGRAWRTQAEWMIHVCPCVRVR